jgi:SAM-dependent methyltransferase
MHGPETMATEEGGWWESERQVFLRERVGAVVPAGGSVLDVGCGTAQVLDGGVRPGVTAVASDSFPWPQWQGRTNCLFVVASADALPFRDGAFDVVGSFDVLEHLPDDHTAAREQVRVCTRRGTVVASVPAFQGLWSVHDENVGHHRRYSRRALRRLFGDAGLRETTGTYFFSFLAPPAWVMRKLDSRGEEPMSGTGLVDRIVQRVLHLVCATERALLRRTSLPFGTSAWGEFTR